MRRAFILSLLIALPGLSAERTVEFNRDVRPILSDKCFHCHGPDAKAKKIPLRLDVEEEAKKKVIVPGDAQASLLLKRVAHEKKAMRMPPPYSQLTLSDPEIATLRTWIEQGAKWQPHWAFLPPARADVPAGAHPVDHFIRRKLGGEGLRPSPEASKVTLLRRASLDLTGIPPTPDEAGAFLSDSAPNAYERAVDRLLASPRYGERMAARWLDAARYADTNGYQYDAERVMWRWRDWVIDAFNRNQPFDRFTLEQIAGDMLPNATPAQRIATGFNRNHRGNTEDGIVPEEYLVEYVMDRVETTSTVFMGVTLGCARCHNHKYDPFTQKEFYQFFAFFNNVPESGRAMKFGNSPPVISAPTVTQERELARHDAGIRDAEKMFTPSLAADRTAWEKTLTAPVRWAPWAAQELDLPDETAFDGTNEVTTKVLPTFDIEDRFTLSAWIKPEKLDGPIVTQMVNSPRGKGYGLHLRRGKLHGHLTSVYADDALRVDSEQALEAGRWVHVALSYDGSRMAQGLRLFIDGAPVRTKVEMETLYRPFRNNRAAVKDPLRIGGGWGKDRRFAGSIRGVHVHGRTLRDEEIGAMSGRADRQALAREWLYLDTVAPPDVRDAWRKLVSLRLEKHAFEITFPTVMVMEEMSPRKDTFLLNRGQYNMKGEKLEPGLPEALPPMPEGAPNNRLGLAKWLVDSKNPLTARVTVNRFWQMYFGIGIVETTEDFGQQGAWPSHPELLDWLATEFVRTGWDVKAMQKLIVTSATYKQSSAATPELIQRDPDNRLLARGPRFRMPAEMVRDQALATAGLLVEKIGGPSVKPYQPEGLWKEITMQGLDYTQDRGENLYRRSLYTFWKRTVVPPMMANFDAPMREACSVRENRTNTPLQALNLMNDVTFLEAARMIGQRMMREGGADPDSRLRYGFQLVLARKPSPAEEKVLRENLSYHLDYFASDAAAAEGASRAGKVLNYGETRSDSALAARELAAYASVASLLLNLDEAVTKE